MLSRPDVWCHVDRSPRRLTELFGFHRNDWRCVYLALCYQLLYPHHRGFENWLLETPVLSKLLTAHSILPPRATHVKADKFGAKGDFSSLVFIVISN